MLKALAFKYVVVLMDSLLLSMCMQFCREEFAVNLNFKSVSDIMKYNRGQEKKSGNQVT